jgi:H+/Cl- antiporter ClcA
MNIADQHNRIPISISLEQIRHQEPGSQAGSDKKRILFISCIAVIIAICISGIGKLLVLLINLITNIAFHYQASAAYQSPANNNLGLFVILVPVIGGLIIGFMALYGSKAIRGHGIPEAMEQILANDSKIRPSIVYLKPLSSAISIGTGGPFGSEGPIIATGGALGSTFGQLLKISAYERKILLASGATAGMSAIFGSAIAAIFLAIELLLFEFSPRSIIPVTLACITGAAGHHLLFEDGPVFKTPFIAAPGNTALAAYSVIGIVTGFVAALVTRAVYIVEDLFEKLPIHWKWWPAIGGLAVGIVGYFAPATLGVGYENITNILSGDLAMHIILPLCILKFVSWAVSLGSGTSGGTLAPLLTIGSAFGALMGMLIIKLFPAAGVSVTLAALVGMSAMFAGASRALLTSIIFAMETTGQANALLPLLAACVASYFISFMLLEHTIMTEKIARRGVITPTAYEPDVLGKIKVGRVVKQNKVILNSHMTLDQVRSSLSPEIEEMQGHYIVTNSRGGFKGIISRSDIFDVRHAPQTTVQEIANKENLTITEDDSLKSAAEIMAFASLDVLPVIDTSSNQLSGFITYKDLLSAYRERASGLQESVAISIKRRTLKTFIKGKKRISVLRGNRRKIQP